MRASPRADPDIDPFFKRVLTQVRAPFPRQDCGVDGTGERVDAKLVITAIDDRADVTRLEFVRANRLEDCFGQRRLIELRLHPVNPRGVEQPAHVRFKPEARRSARRAVAPSAFEDGAAIVNDMRSDMNGRVFPIDQFAVHPDFAGARECHSNSLITLEGLRPSDSPTRSLASRFDGPLPSPGAPSPRSPASSSARA